MASVNLNTNQLKYIAIFAMLLDHIAWSFLTFTTPLAMAFHFIGRITAPIMCFFIAQGYDLTKNKTKYGLRLFIFALISQLPWIIYHGFTIYNFSLNMIFTLFICFLAVHIESTVKNNILKILGIIFLCICTIHCDWYVYAVLYSVCFYRYKNSNKKRFIAFSIISLSYFAITLSMSSLVNSIYTLGTFMALGFIGIYNKDKPYSRKSKWVFYIFYPAHLMLLALFK